MGSRKKISVDMGSIYISMPDQFDDSFYFDSKIKFYSEKLKNILSSNSCESKKNNKNNIFPEIIGFSGDDNKDYFELIKFKKIIHDGGLGLSTFKINVDFGDFGIVFFSFMNSDLILHVEIHSANIFFRNFISGFLVDIEIEVGEKIKKKVVLELN